MWWGFSEFSWLLKNFQLDWTLGFIMKMNSLILEDIYTWLAPERVMIQWSNYAWSLYEFSWRFWWWQRWRGLILLTINILVIPCRSDMSSVALNLSYLALYFSCGLHCLNIFILSRGYLLDCLDKLHTQLPGLDHSGKCS